MSSLSNLNDYWRLHSDELAERILASYPPAQWQGHIALQTRS